MRKDELDAGTAPRAQDAEGFGNRKLIRPSLPRPLDAGRLHAVTPVLPRAPQAARSAAPARKAAPPEQTHAENFYYQKQMQARIPLVFVLKDGEEIHGVLDWYDRQCLKVTRTDGQPNLLLYKPSIKYIYKQAETGPEPGNR